MEDLEVWKNAGQARIVIQRLSSDGPRHEMIAGGRTFTISPRERQLNQNLAATPGLDVFANGMLFPVELLEATEDTVRTNPNHLSDDQLPALFKLHYRTFAKRMSEISNPIVLERLLTIAPEHATIKQLEMIKERIAELCPEQKPPEVDDSGEPKIRAVTPR